MLLFCHRAQNAAIYGLPVMARPALYLSLRGPQGRGNPLEIAASFGLRGQVLPFASAQAKGKT